MRFRTVVCSGIYMYKSIIVDGRHVFTGDLCTAVTAVTNRRTSSRGAVEYARNKAAKCRTVLCGGIRIVDERRVFIGDLDVSVTAVTNRRLDDRGEHLHSAISTVKTIQTFNHDHEYCLPPLTAEELHKPQTLDHTEPSAHGAGPHHSLRAPRAR